MAEQFRNAATPKIEVHPDIERGENSEFARVLQIRNLTTVPEDFAEEGNASFESVSCGDGTSLQTRNKYDDWHSHSAAFS
jgi:hypothetical protein